LKTSLGYEIQFHQYGTLLRYEVRARRFKDLRKREHWMNECRTPIQEIFLKVEGLSLPACRRDI
jgi:hypothetical protein